MAEYKKKKKKKAKAKKGHTGVGRVWSSAPGDTGGTDVSPRPKRAPKILKTPAGAGAASRRFTSEAIAKNKKDWAKRKKVLIPQLQAKIDRLQKSKSPKLDEIKKIEKWLAKNK